MVFIPQGKAAVQVVSGDGNCLFASFCAGYAWHFSGGAGFDAVELCAHAVRHILSNASSVYMGLSYSEWIHHTFGVSAEEYNARLLGRNFHGLDEATFGGALEAGAIAGLTHCSAHLFYKVPGGYHRVCEALPATGANVNTIPATCRHVCVVRAGNHVDALILKPM